MDTIFQPLVIHEPGAPGALSPEVDQVVMPPPFQLEFLASVPFGSVFSWSSVSQGKVQCWVSSHGSWFPASVFPRDPSPGCGGPSLDLTLEQEGLELWSS